MANKLLKNQIISSLERKLESGLPEHYDLGPELRYLGALPTSNNNNFEEEMLLGEDKLITSKIIKENDVYYKYQEFKFKREVDENYYVLIVKERLEDNRPVKFEVKLDKPVESGGVNSLYLIYTDNIPIVESPTILKEFKLYYCEEGGGPEGSDLMTLISTREVTQNPPTTVNDIKSVLTEEVITPNPDIQGE